MLRDAQDFFQKKSEELGVEKEYFDSGFVKATNDVIDAVFKADDKRTGGKIDENKLTERIFKKLRG